MSGPDPLPPIEEPSWLSESGGTAPGGEPFERLRGVTAPDGIMSQETRDALGNEFDQQIAGTGGIETVTAERTETGALRVTIEGTVGRDGLARTTDRAGPDKPLAPNFNSRTSSLLRAGDLGLSHHDWQRAHVWGPGFGDEAAAGIWFANTEVNQLLQNQVSERFIRELADGAAERGGQVRLAVTAERFSSEALAAVPEQGEALKQGDFLKEISYKIEVEIPGEPPRDLRVEFTLEPPPDGGLASFECDPESRPIIESFIEELGSRR